MKDLLTQKIELEVKLAQIQLVQNYYSKRIDWQVYNDLSAKLMANKKRLLDLIASEGDMSIRTAIEPQQYPYNYYVKHLQQDEASTNNL